MKLTTMINDLHRFSMRKKKPINTLIYKTMQVAAVSVAYVAAHSKDPVLCSRQFANVFRDTVDDYVRRFRDADDKTKKIG